MIRAIGSLLANVGLIVVLFCILGLFVSCSLEERKDIQADVGAYVGAQEDSSVAVVVAKTIEEAAKRGASPAELVAWSIGLGVTVLTGYVKRKFILKKYAQVKAKVVAAVVEPPVTPDPPSGGVI